MRLSISLDDDVYALARSLARAEEITVSAAVNRLVRRGVDTSSTGTARPKRRNGLRVSPGRLTLTADVVGRIEREDNRG